MWRAVLFGFIAGLVAGFIVGFIGGMAGADTRTITTLSGIAGLLVAIPVGMWVIKVVLTRKYSDFRIALVSAG
jgi:ABC-type uncharacterized transport system permease subunit